MGINNSIRHQLATLAKSRRTRVAEFRRDRPIRWEPETVQNPSGIIDSYFSESSAWELIVHLLESGEEVEEITLDKPPGATGYVMVVEIQPEKPPVYIKVQLGSGQIIGRSFHYSTESGSAGNGSENIEH